HGWLSWVVNEADAVDIGFPDAGYAAAACLRDVAWENETPVAGGAAPNFHQCFVEQLRNVLAFMRGHAAPVLSGENVLESVRLVEHCHGHRTPMRVPWLDDGEQRNARRQADG